MNVVTDAGVQHGADVVGVARRLGMLDDAFDVVAAGGVHRAGEPRFSNACLSGEGSEPNWGGVRKNARAPG